MPQVNCDNCGTVFECQNFRIMNRSNLFCSKRCEGQYRKNQTELNCECEVCGVKFHRKAYYVKKVKHVCCSKQCDSILRKTTFSGANNHQYGLKGDKNSSWKSNERVSSYGYRLIRDLDHPFKNSDDFVFEHRLLADKYLLTDENNVEINGKRYLKPEYIVHHIDKNRLNNDINNLRVMTLQEHIILHNTKN